MYTPLISVIVPVYNTAPYLIRCIDSLRNNTYQDLEIICVNDGSTDNSLEILRQLESSDKRIIVIDQSNGGLSVARNTGLRYAKGEFVALFDSDDWCHQRYFETMIQHQLSSNADIVVVDYCSVHDGDLISEPEFDNVNHRLLDRAQALQDRYISGYVWGRIFRSAAIKDHFFLQNLVPREDTAYNFAVLCSSEELRIVHVSLPLYYYYQRSGSLVRTGPLANLQPLSEWYLTFLKKTDDPFCKKAAMERAFKMALANRYISVVRTGRVAQRECNTLLYACFKPMLKDRGITIFRKLIYFLFYCCPSLYRAFRLHSDPSLKKWERSEKDQRKNCRRTGACQWNR